MSKQPPITRKDLVRILTEASLFVGSPDIPLLNTVRLEATGTHLIAVATDRFSMGVSSADYEGTPFEITVPMAEVKLILGACKLKSGRFGLKDDVDLRVTPKGTLLHVTLNETVITVPTYRAESNPEWKQAYVDWRKLLGDTTAAIEEVTGTFAVNPQYVARFGKIGRNARFYLRGADKPIMARVGDNFVGLVMPIRIPNHVDPKVWTLPDWLENPTAIEKAS